MPLSGACCCLEGTYTLNGTANGAPMYRKGATQYIILFDGIKWVNTEDANVGSLPAAGWYKQTPGNASAFPSASATWFNSSGCGGSSTFSNFTYNNGTITNATTLTPTFTPVASQAGTAVTLTMTVSNAPCPAATATYTINVDPLPTATAGGSSTICETGTATVSGSTSSNGLINWTENGFGSITAGQGTLAPTYTAGAGDGGTHRQ